MNRTLSEMLHCTDMTVLERQRARLKWQQEQIQQDHQSNYFTELTGVFSLPGQVSQGQDFQGNLMNCGGGDSGLGEVVTRSVKPDPGLEKGWPDLGKIEMPGLGIGPSGYVNASDFELNYAISRTSSCPPAVVAAAAEVAEALKRKESILSEKIGRESFKKRKADKVNNSKVVAEDEIKDKKIKTCAEEEDSKITEQNNTKSTKNTTNNNNNSKSENSGETSKENSKVSEVVKPDYIHVRARRGQATDSHSLAERVRREKISERMKYLQDLVPGCNKITGKAGMLDEIINYVQSLQRQVEFLSMKLAAVNPRLDFNIDNLFAKEVYPNCTASFPSIGMSSDLSDLAIAQYNQVQQVVSCCGLEMGINPLDLGLRRTISAPVSIPDTVLDSSCFNQIQPCSTWDADLQNLCNVGFDQGRSTNFPSQPYTGFIEASNLKMEM